MKQSLLNLALFLSIFVFFSCKDDSESPQMSVDHYVSLLKAEKYENWELPEFNANDIPKLLAYRNDTQSISNFPRNPISSSITSECTLGMYVLWTVESIRARSFGSEYLTGTFPSQNPVVKEKETLEFVEQTNLVQQEIGNAYFNWWETNKEKDFSEFNQIDPLETTDFRWH